MAVPARSSVCKNGSYHLRGNVYVHYKSLESATLAYNTMNGRYFARKQITCEFVDLTRWKVAICGEYMKSRLKTCSRGTACNFIHCFRNPGGDYEWADWDNPPPKYWIRKMAVLFGHSGESSYGKQMELDDFESPTDSSRKGTPMHSRSYHSKKSPCDETKVRDRNRWYHSKKSPCDETKVRDRKRGRQTSNSRRDQSERRRESLRDKSEQSEENHESKVLDHDIKNYPHRHDSSEDRSKRRHSKKHQSHEAHQKHKTNQRTKEELSTWQPRKTSSDKQEKSERKYQPKSSKIRGEGQNLSDQLSGNADDRSNRSTSCPSKEFYFSRHAIDVQDRHDDRYCSNDSDYGKDFSKQNGSRCDNQVIEKIDQYKIEHRSSDDRSTADEFPDRWQATVNISDTEEIRDHSCNGSNPSCRKARQSDGKCRHCRRKREYEIDSLCSDEELDRWEHEKYSRNRTPTRWTTSSEKTIQGRSND